ncbi:MAG: hypothetical protein P8P36_05950 [Akkermansiaceae bacterium]|nr:hypothetical protein [Akkermansiaceae bacterium]
MNRVIQKTPLYAFKKAVAVGTLLMSIAPWAGAEERVLIDFNMQTPPPADCMVEGYAFGTHTPTPAERQKAAASPSISSESMN